MEKNQDINQAKKAISLVQEACKAPEEREACAAFMGLLDELADKREALRWRSLKEERPEDLQFVLVDGKPPYAILCFNAESKCWDAPDTDDYFADLSDGDMWLPVPQYEPEEE